MPLYAYRRADGTTFEIRQKFSDAPLETCPTTGQVVHRVPQASSIIFKGSGFYVTDNKSATKSTTVNGNGTTGEDKATPATKSETTTPAPAKAEVSAPAASSD